MEENLKKELHSFKLQLKSTMENNKIIEETVTTLKQEFKQKESKFLTDFSNLKHLNDKLENKLHSQDQSIQTVHMMLYPTQPYHVSVIVSTSEEELELAEATRNKLHVKMNDSICVEKRVNIMPPNYSKENFMATFTPQTQLRPEQVFWSLDLAKRKAEELKANATPLPILPPATVYPPNTLAHLVPRTLPTTSQVNIGLYVITQLFWDFEKTCKKRITPTGITEGEQGFEQTKRCYLTEVIPFLNLLKEHFEGIKKSLVTEVRAMKAVFKNLEAEVDQNETDLRSDIMADVNAPIEQAPAVAPPTRTDEQILPRIRWVPIGKSNCYLDAEKSQSNPIYKITVDILKHTNFFRAFTASSTIPAIYIQQFWDTICYDRTDGGYKCQLDEQWFNLTKDTLRDALQITPVNNNKAFSSPPTQDTLINFVNDLGYPKEVKHLSNVVTNDMFQPWRALTTIINLCLTGKTSGFERPRAPVLQILWGIINRAHIDYAERMWEEFTQSIHTFTEDKKNLAQHTQGKKKATLIVIPSVRFTKLIIFHLQRKHKFHPRPESPLHLPTEEPILGYLKFSAKGTKREVFGMPIPNELITDDIRGADYYGAYLQKVAKHQRYLVGEEVSDPDSPAPKPTKSTKPKITKQAKLVAPKAATKKPQPAGTKPKEKKRKQAKETTEATQPAKRAKARKVVKKRTLKSSQQLVDEFVDEGIPLTEPGFGDLEADTQRTIEESLKDAHSAHRGPLLLVVFRETDTGKFQPLLEVEGKGKEKVSAEQAAWVLLNLQTLKKKSPTEQYIFQRRTSTLTKPLGHDESSSLYAVLGLTESDTKSDEEVPPVVKMCQTLSTPGVHARPNLEHTDAEATDATSQPQPGQMDEEFTATAYPNIQENLKLTVDDLVIPEEPASSTRTLSSLQHLAKDFSFGDQFFNDKPLEANNEKTT
ncbi:hypothetical protein Tco_1069329 [Tanacetum coccineum]|uniref:Monodehydroascorbate reductase n=1 Tax=Tanacetum coccineum TaxID=301880 RepID=A0ABQ5HK34_9ASTR